MNIKKKTMYNFMSDTTFKYFLKHEEYKNWFYEIIKTKTGIDLNEYELTNNESNTGNVIKDYRMDVVYQNKKKDTKVIIEANDSSESGISVLKAYQYLYRVESEEIEVGEKYKSKYTKLIMFNNFKNKKDETIKITNYIFQDPIHNIKREDIESWEIYLPNFHNICYDKLNEIDKRLYILGCEDMSELEKLDTTGENLKIIKAYERLQEEDPKFVYEYRKEKETKMSINTAKEEGIEQSRLEIAKSLLKLNVNSLEQIHMVTGLTIEELEKLKEECSKI